MSDLVIVPGYVPPWQRRPVRLHPAAARRVARAVAVAQERGIPRLMASGGAVWPPGTPHVEAEAMAEEARRLGWTGELLLEGRARHTTTNLRNCGRLLLDRGWGEALVVTGPVQWAYLAWPERSGFFGRCERELGYRVGTLRRDGCCAVRFQPSGACRRPGRDPADP